MKGDASLVIGAQTIAPGETRVIQLEFGESYLRAPVTLPVHVMSAAEPGPRVFLAGAIHGDELNGMGIIRELLYDNPPSLLCGSLICIPVVNIYGFERHTRYMPDRRDLNRCFPGSKEGSLAGRLAYAIFTEIVMQCDYGIDFHTAAIRRTNYPNVRADMRDAPTSTLAKAFGCELIVHSRGPKGSLRRIAVAHGTPTIILEAGEVWKIEPGVVEVGMRGCLNVLCALKMIDGAVEAPAFQTRINKTSWVRAEQGGVLDFHAKPGDLVSEGQDLATSQSIFGRDRKSVLCPVDGLVLGMSTMPVVKPGEPIYCIAHLSKAAFARIRKQAGRNGLPESFTRIQEDLATNVTIHER